MNRSDSQPLISVIVPAYEAQLYLNRCIASIVQQTYSNLEIILVDDGSKDGTGAICDAWAENDNRIIVIHQSNGGVGNARNSGLAVAHGSYIAWVDSDDWIDQGYIATLYAILHRNQADMVVSQNWVGSDDLLLKDDTVLRYQLMNELGVLWCTLAKAELFENLSFGDYAVCEDLMMLTDVCAKCSRVVVGTVDGYHYTQREGSASSSFDDATVLSRLDAIEARSRHVYERYRKSWRYIHYATVLETSIVHRQIRGKVSEQHEFIMQRIHGILKSSVFRVPLWTLRPRQFREWLAGVKILFLG